MPNPSPKRDHGPFLHEAFTMKPSALPSPAIPGKRPPGPSVRCRILQVLRVDVELAVEVDAVEVAQLGGEAVGLEGGRQPVAEHDLALVDQVPGVAVRPGDEAELRYPVEVRLVVGRHLDAVVVCEHHAKADLLDTGHNLLRLEAVEQQGALQKGGQGAQLILLGQFRRRPQVVAQDDLAGTVRGAQSPEQKAPFDQRPEPYARAGDEGVFHDRDCAILRDNLPGDLHAELDVVGDQDRSPLVVLGGVVAQLHDDEVGPPGGLLPRQEALQWIAVEAVPAALAVVAVDQGETHGQALADVRFEGGRPRGWSSGRTSTCPRARDRSGARRSRWREGGPWRSCRPRR